MTGNIIVFPGTPNRTLTQWECADLARWAASARVHGVARVCIDWCQNKGEGTGYEYVSVTDTDDETIAIVFRPHGERDFLVIMPGLPGCRHHEAGRYRLLADALFAIRPVSPDHDLLETRA